MMKSKRRRKNLKRVKLKIKRKFPAKLIAGYKNSSV
jgi:hypothetical protein